ncbi:helix-turn-helix transcriptional regulator [Xylanimonas sp. McL0601]|uniref:helix-turn-helix transcriptional regulator n=1 Tax=Xylanimonas sp. McL0601 TaxID=3414739 RepID=UPI003CF2943A
MAEARPRVQRTGLGPARADVLDHLRRSGQEEPLADIAEAVQLSPSTTRFHLDALVRDGLVIRETEKRAGAGRPRALYRAEAPRAPAPDEAAMYQGLAGALVRQLVSVANAGEQAEAAGYAWGTELAAERQDLEGVDRIVDMLGELSYRPEVVGKPPRAIEMRPCPFKDLLEIDAAVVCRLHLGLMRGLVADDPELRVTGLEPWTTPTTCVARLEHRHA